MNEEGSIRRGSFAGVPIIWNFTVLFIPIAIFYHYARFGLPVRSALTVGLGAAIIGSILLHEAAHVWMARRCRVGAEAILLHGFGGLAFLSRQPSRRWDQVRISIAGPVANLVLAAIGYGLLLLVEAAWPPPGFRQHSHISSWHLALLAGLRGLAQVNLLLGFVNLLPAFPLDGGTIARTLLEQRFPQRTAMRITAGLGIFSGLWLCTGAGVIGVGALAMGLLLVILNVWAWRDPENWSY